jgi:Predicted permease
VHSHARERDRGVQALRMFGAEMNTMLPALVVGCAVAGFIQVAVSRDLLLTLGQNPVWSVLALMGLAFVIAICSTVDAFFILSLGSLFTPGGGRLLGVRSDDRHQDAGVAAYHVHGFDTRPPDDGGGFADGSDGVGGQPCVLKPYSGTGAGLPSICWA